MNRTRDYYRKQRRRAIERKTGILRKIGGEPLVYAWSHDETGRFSKGKIHCSCPMCRMKSYDDLKIRDKRRQEDADEQINEIGS